MKTVQFVSYSADFGTIYWQFIDDLLLDMVSNSDSSKVLFNSNYQISPPHLVLQAHPLRPTRAVVLRTHVFSHICLTLDNELPGLLAICHANGVVSLEDFILPKKPRRPQHSLGIFALLEAHDVVGRLRRAADQMSGTAAAAPLHLEEMPPKEVVGQDLKGIPRDGNLPQDLGWKHGSKSCWFQFRFFKLFGLVLSFR